MSNKVVNKKRVADPDEEEFLLAENRHDEITTALGRLATAISKPKEDKGIAEAIKQGAEVMKQSVDVSKAVAQAIKELPKPEVNGINNDDFLIKFNKIADRICTSNESAEKSNERIAEALENKALVDKFDFVYDNGWIKTAKVVYKPANQVMYSKPKAQA